MKLVIIEAIRNEGEKGMYTKGIIVTTTDLKEDYEIIGPVYYQISNKGIFSSEMDRKISEYEKLIKDFKNSNLMEDRKNDWGFLYGEYTFGMQNDFDKAFYIAVEELKLKAEIMGADAIVGMKQDIDLDTNSIQYFYLQMYGTAVKIKK